MQCATRADDIAQGSVDPVAHNGMRLERLYMYVAGTIARSLSEQRVDHADDGRIVAGLEQVFDLRHVLHQAIKIDFVGCGIHDFGSVARLCIRSGQERIQFFIGHLPYRQRTVVARSEEHTSELQSLMRISYAVFCLTKKTHQHSISNTNRLTDINIP